MILEDPNIKSDSKEVFLIYYKEKIYFKTYRDTLIETGRAHRLELACATQQLQKNLLV